MPTYFIHASFNFPPSNDRTTMHNLVSHSNFQSVVKMYELYLVRMT